MDWPIHIMFVLRCGEINTAQKCTLRVVHWLRRHGGKAVIRFMTKDEILLQAADSFLKYDMSMSCIIVKMASFLRIKISCQSVGVCSQKMKTQSLVLREKVFCCSDSVSGLSIPLIRFCRNCSSIGLINVLL